jgi:threonine/homoserine/homoserine lactone efflux protein
MWLAIVAVRRGSALNVRGGEQRTEPWHKIFLLGVGINLTNPKVVLFFVTFLPQFIDAGDPHASGKLLFLGLYFIAFALPLCVLMILAADSVIAGLKGRPRLMRTIDYSFAGLFGAFAVKILAAQGR